MSGSELFRHFRLFSHFDDALLGRLAEVSVTQRFAAKGEVLRQGDATAHVFLTLRGALRVQRSTPFGPFTFFHVLPGDLLGDLGFVDGKSHYADVVAETDAEVFRFPVEGLTNLTAADPAFAAALFWSLWRSLSAKLRKSNDRLTNFFASEAGAKIPRTDEALGLDDSGFRLDLGTKRDLFEEQRLSPLEINFLSSLSREKKFQPGEQIFNEGEPGGEMFVVLAGSVMISKFIPGAGDEALAFLGRGEYFGEMALIDQLPRSASAKAHDQGVTVLVMPRHVIEGILNIEKVSSIRLLKLLCSMVARRLRESDEKLLSWFILSTGQQA